MKNVTPTTTLNIYPLSSNELTSIFGGSDDVIDPETLLGDITPVVIEDETSF